MEIVLLDADVVVHRATHSAMEEIHFDDEIALRMDLGQAKELVDQEMVKIRDKFNVEEIVPVLSYTGVPWRRSIHPPYKLNRKGGKPVGYKAVREYLDSVYRGLTLPPLEGDDVLGILATYPYTSYRVPGRYVRLPPVEERLVMSVDKDMRTFPCNLVTSWEDDPVGVTEDEAFFNFMHQTLTGDRTDGYAGCPRVGPKTATKALMEAGGVGADPFDLWYRVVREYEDRGKTAEDALKFARCAHILQHDGYDIENQMPLLWEPPK